MDLRVGLCLEAVDDLLDGNDGFLRSQHGFFLNAHDAPDHHVAEPIRLLRMDHRHVGPRRRYGGELLLGERTLDALDSRVVLRQVGPQIAANDRGR